MSELRAKHGSTHVFKRDGKSDTIVDIPVANGARPLGDESTLIDLTESLVIEASVYRGLPSHVAALCRYLIAGDRHGLEERSTAAGDDRNYQVVAAAGYALTGGCGDGRVARFKGAMEQLSGRAFFAEGRTPRFEIDGIGLLGVALGAKAAGLQRAGCGWLESLLERSARTLKSDGRESDLVEIARGAIDPEYEVAVKDVRLRIAFSLTASEEEMQAAWREMVARSGNRDAVEIAVNRAVLDYCGRALGAARVGGLGVAGLVGLLEGLAQSMSHWTYEKTPRVTGRPARRWEVDHEYHVQNLLWTVLRVLRPVWSDLVDEQSLPKVGHKTHVLILGFRRSVRLWRLSSCAREAEVHAVRSRKKLLRIGRCT